MSVKTQKKRLDIAINMSDYKKLMKIVTKDESNITEWIRGLIENIVEEEDRIQMKMTNS
jgi:predicted transport protein